MSTKRLSDGEVADGYGACDQGPLNGVPCAPCRADLKADHLQAREDVKRLAAMLCWAVDRDLFRNEDEEKDGEVRAFLREVEAVRQ